MRRASARHRQQRWSANLPVSREQVKSAGNSFPLCPPFQHAEQQTDKRPRSNPGPPPASARTYRVPGGLCFLVSGNLPTPSGTMSRSPGRTARNSGRMSIDRKQPEIIEGPPLIPHFLSGHGLPEPSGKVPSSRFSAARGIRRTGTFCRHAGARRNTASTQYTFFNGR